MADPHMILATTPNPLVDAQQQHNDQIRRGQFRHSLPEDWRHWHYHHHTLPPIWDTCYPMPVEQAASWCVHSLGRWLFYDYVSGPPGLTLVEAHQLYMHTISMSWKVGHIRPCIA